MNFSGQNSVRLELKGDCTIYEISVLYEKLSEQFENGTSISLDLLSVEKVDASFLQLLACAQLEANRNELKLEISGLSDVVNKFAENINCQVSLGSTDNVTASGE